MEIIEVDAYYVPPDFRPQVKDFRTEVYQDENITIHLKIPQISTSFVETLTDHLKKRRETYLASLPIGKIIDVLDEASRKWLERDYPLRKLALKTIPFTTRFSRDVVEASIDVEMQSSLREDIWHALCSEIKNPLFLDDFQYSPELNGYSRAFGPKLIISIFSENIPALPHLLFMRSALLKAACLGKVATGEPTFAPLYLKTIEEIDPEMAESMAVLYWRGGEEDIEGAAFHQADAVIMFGGVEACESLREKIPRGVKVLLHGHRLGFGIIGRKRLRRKGLWELAASVAYDCSMFDQQACLAPHVYYLEAGGEVSPKEFCRTLAEAMERLNLKMPRGKISPGEASAIHQLRAKYEFRELNGKEVLLLASPHGTDWTIVYEKDPGIFSPSPLNRFIRIFGVEDILQILPSLKSIASYLQNAAVAIGDEREKELIRRLGELGVARITSPGKMPVPSMMWHHDGISPLASLLRWCDIEKKDGIDGVKR
ncbi:MAG: acyl-CoA reductase [bacterium]